MRIGLTETLLLLAIAAVAFGPAVSVWTERWIRRAQKSTAAAARRRAEQEAMRRAERDEILHRFRVTACIFAAGAALALIYTLVLRPIDPEPQPYSAPPVEQASAGRTVSGAQELALGGWQNVSCIRAREDWLYLSAQDRDGAGAILRVRQDGSGLAAILTLEGEITGFDFDPAGDIWLTALTDAGGALYRAGYDGWGAALEQVVTQIDGRALGCPAAVAVGPDGRVYFADAAAAPAKAGAMAALRTELLAHTATGWVYVYDPADRTVQRVLGGVAGAAGLALSPDGGTLYVSDLGQRCVWMVSASGRELSAGGRGCGLLAEGLPGYPAGLAADEEGTVYVSYLWARCGWLEEHAGGTLLRGAALRLTAQMQRILAGLTAPAPAAQAYSPDGALTLDFAAAEPASTPAVCSAGSRVYLGAADGQSALCWLRY